MDEDLDEGTDRIVIAGDRLERGGRPWFPVSGEVHHCRVPRARWSRTLGHARSGGLTTVATYVFWQVHEPAPGRFRWDGDLDLRAFVELAGRHDLDVVVRMGPWAHGEARHGGFPDWLVDRGLRTRTDDPDYLALVRRFYGEVIAQFHDLTHEHGGPVVGVQLDNELYDQPGHLSTLRAIAEEAGLRVPLWTATGWGGAQVPEHLLRLYSGYADGFWEEADVEWPAFAPAHFRFSSHRDDLTVGADVRAALGGTAADEPGHAAGPEHPFATCELGGGMHVAYHRRPLVQPEDVAALALAKIGSGSVWQGYYMYAGGTQRLDEDGHSLQETHASGYPNDVPPLTYDFGAPLGEHGQVRRHHHLLRRQHLWLALDGPGLAAMASTARDDDGAVDPTALRWCARTDGTRGYAFLTTHQPAAHRLPPQPGVQLTVPFRDGPVTVPTRPVDVPAGVWLAWPLRYPLGRDLLLRSATAQLLTRLDLPDGDLLVLVATAGIPVELVLDGPCSVRGPVRVRHEDGATVVDLAVDPGPTTVVDLDDRQRVLVLDEAGADRLYDVHFAGARRLVLSDVPLHAADGALQLDGDRPDAELALLPAAGLRAEGAVVLAEGGDGPWTRTRLRFPAAGTVRLAEDLRPSCPGPVPAPVRGGPMHRLSAPTDFTGAAVVHLDPPADVLGGADQVLLRVDWTGDVGRAVVGGRVVGDHFWHGRVWDVDLTPHREEIARTGLDLQLLPWDPAAGIWVDPTVRGAEAGVHVRSVDVIRIQHGALHPATAGTPATPGTEGTGRPLTTSRRTP